MWFPKHLVYFVRFFRVRKHAKIFQTPFSLWKAIEWSFSHSFHSTKIVLFRTHTLFSPLLIDGRYSSVCLFHLPDKLYLCSCFKTFQPSIEQIHCKSIEMPHLLLLLLPLLLCCSLFTIDHFASFQTYIHVAESTLKRCKYTQTTNISIPYLTLTSKWMPQNNNNDEQPNNTNCETKLSVVFKYWKKKHTHTHYHTTHVNPQKKLIYKWMKHIETVETCSIASKCSLW